MMKKLGMFAFVMALAVAFSLPAYAGTIAGEKEFSVTIGGSYSLDANWNIRDKNYNTFINPAGGGKDQTKFIMDVPFWSYMYILVRQGGFSGYADIATSISRESNQLQVPTSNFQNDADFITNGRWYGSYRFGNMEIRAGKDNGWFDSDAYGVGGPSVLGYSAANTSHVALIGWGWTYDGKSANLRFLHNVNKMFGYQIALVDTGTYAETVGTATRLSYAQYPGIAAKILLNFGVVSLYPAAVYQQVKWDSLTPGFQDNMTAWAATLPVRVTVGPFSAGGQITYGKNVGGATSGNVLLRGENSNTGYLRDAAGNIQDTTDWAGFIALGYAFGPAQPYIWFGFDHAQNDHWKNIFNANDYYQRTSYGINLYYTIGNFQIVPEVAFYDYGNLAGVPGKQALGTEWLAGVHFRFSF